MSEKLEKLLLHLNIEHIHSLRKIVNKVWSIIIKWAVSAYLRALSLSRSLPARSVPLVTQPTDHITVQTKIQNLGVSEVWSSYSDLSSRIENSPDLDEYPHFFKIETPELFLFFFNSNKINFSILISNEWAIKFDLRSGMWDWFVNSRRVISKTYLCHWIYLENVLFDPFLSPFLILTILLTANHFCFIFFKIRGLILCIWI